MRVDQLILLARDDVGLGSFGKKGSLKRHLGGGLRRPVGGLDLGHSVSFAREGTCHRSGRV